MQARRYMFKQALSAATLGAWQSSETSFCVGMHDDGMKPAKTGSAEAQVPNIPGSAMRQIERGAHGSRMPLGLGAWVDALSW